MQPNDSVIYVELRERHAPQAVGTCDFDLRPQAQQRGGRIARKGRPAGLTAGSDMTQVTVFLKAEAATLPPQQRLVVPEAARIETDVATERTHVSQHRRRNGSGCLVQHRIFTSNKR